MFFLSSIFHLLSSIFIPSVYSQSDLMPGDRYAIVVGGIGGQQEFTDKYYEQTSRLYGILVDSLDYDPANVIYLFEKTEYDSLRINAAATAQNTEQSFQKLGSRMNGNDQLLVFLVGHGSHDGTWSKFNLVGPDLRDIDFARLLAALPTKRVVFVNTASASGPFIEKLSDEERIIVTATRSGSQVYETTFAEFFLDALSSGAADQNKDGKVSVLEAFELAKSNQESQFEDERRLSTENPLLDDNGDGHGSEEFLASEGDGLWASRVSLSPVSEQLQKSLQNIQTGVSTRADSLRLEKVRLTNAIEDLKARKSQMESTEYSKQLETLLIRLARLDRQLKSAPQ